MDTLAKSMQDVCDRLDAMAEGKLYHRVSVAGCTKLDKPSTPYTYSVCAYTKEYFNGIPAYTMKYSGRGSTLEQAVEALHRNMKSDAK